MNLSKEIYDEMVKKARSTQCVQQAEFEHEGKTYQASVNPNGECLEEEVVEPKAE